mmetsp:Transcript_1729/g.5657  ORF Transcript_1729/g.5657 Transcript_1729/m.5657 type:complete len:253 (-) Transcript_1729:420-1178(-)
MPPLPLAWVFPAPAKLRLLGRSHHRAAGTPGNGSMERGAEGSVSRKMAPPLPGSLCTSHAPVSTLKAFTSSSSPAPPWRRNRLAHPDSGHEPNPPPRPPSSPVGSPPASRSLILASPAAFATSSRRPTAAACCAALADAPLSYAPVASATSRSSSNKNTTSSSGRIARSSPRPAGRLYKPAYLRRPSTKTNDFVSSSCRTGTSIRSKPARWPEESMQTAIASLPAAAMPVPANASLPWPPPPQETLNAPIAP